MAERRMFARTIVDSDAFLDMPMSAQCLYFHLAMRADDEGFVNSPKKIQRMVGAADDDAKLLIAKNFIIPFESGVVVIKHWRIHNYLRSDRFTPTKYQDERSLLTIKDNGAYTMESGIPAGIPTVHQADTQYSIDKDNKDSIGKNNRATRFVPPTIEEVQDYCKERGNIVDAQDWYDWYSAVGWKVGRNQMRDWKAAVRTWERDKKTGKKKSAPVYPTTEKHGDDAERLRRLMGVEQ